LNRFDGGIGTNMRKAAHPSGGMGSSNPCRWRGERLCHHGDGVCKVICAVYVVFDSWLVSWTRPTYVLEVSQSEPPRLAPYHLQSYWCWSWGSRIHDTSRPRFLSQSDSDSDSVREGGVVYCASRLQNNNEWAISCMKRRRVCIPKCEKDILVVKLTRVRLAVIKDVSWRPPYNI
jgi:hypothetical protein